MRVLNLLTSGGLGGIEILNYDFGKSSSVSQGFAFLFGTGPTYERMKQASFDVYNLSRYQHKISRNRFVELKKIAKEYDVVVVHHGDPYLKLYYIYLVQCCKKKGVTFVHSCWDDTLFFPHDVIKHSLGKMLFQRAMDVSEYVIFVSKAGKKSYEENYAIRVNTKIIYNGIGQDKIDDGMEHQLAKRSNKELIYIGRIEKIKGIDILLEAIAELVSKYDIHLNIVGEGSHKQLLMKKAEMLGITQKVDFLGGKTDVKPYLKGADIFVYPSIWQEVFGISIVEAMAYGLICVANNVGGIPEVLQDGYNGYLNHTNDIQGLVDALKLAFHELESTDSKMISRAKRTAEKFSVKNTCHQLDALYEGIVSCDGKQEH